MNNILEIDNSVELLSTFQLFYHNYGRLPLTNDPIIVPDGDVLDGEEKVNFKNLYEMFRHTKSHGLVSIQFLGVLSIFFGVDSIQIKNSITELYKNLSYATLSGANNFNFNDISDLINALSFSIKKNTLANIKEEEDLKKEEEIIDSMIFAPLPNPFEQDFINDQFKNDLEHQKKKNRTSLCWTTSRGCSDYWIWYTSWKQWIFKVKPRIW